MENNIKIDIEGIVWDVVDWIHLAQIRDEIGLFLTWQ